MTLMYIIPFVQSYVRIVLGCPVSAFAAVPALLLQLCDSLPAAVDGPQCSSTASVTRAYGSVDDGITVTDEEFVPCDSESRWCPPLNTHFENATTAVSILCYECLVGEC
jgi:hypothetical protein